MLDAKFISKLAERNVVKSKRDKAIMDGDIIGKAYFDYALLPSVLFVVCNCSVVGAGNNRVALLGKNMSSNAIHSHLPTRLFISCLIFE